MDTLAKLKQYLERNQAPYEVILHEEVYQEFKDLFPEAEIGAMPPFGNLYNIEVWMDTSLTTDDHIAFNAGTHYKAVRMRYSDFERLVRPRVASFSVRI